MPTKWFQVRVNGSKYGSVIPLLEKAPVLDPFFDDLARAKSAKELKEHLETRVLLSSFADTGAKERGPELSFRV